MFAQFSAQIIAKDPYFESFVRRPLWPYYDQREKTRCKPSQMPKQTPFEECLMAFQEKMYGFQPNIKIVFSLKERLACRQGARACFNLDYSSPIEKPTAFIAQIFEGETLIKTVKVAIPLTVSAFKGPYYKQEQYLPYLEKLFHKVETVLIPEEIKAYETPKHKTRWALPSVSQLFEEWFLSPAAESYYLMLPERFILENNSLPQQPQKIEKQEPAMAPILLEECLTK